MTTLTRSLAIPLATMLLVTVVSAADSPADPSTPGALRVASPDGALVEMPLAHTKVTIEVTAFVARTTVEQVFVNPFHSPVEAVYTFPLGHRAAVDDFELVVGDRTIRGTIKRREEARADYEQARAAGYQAALLEQERPNIFTQSVANLEPGKPITVRLRTVETLRYERGLYRLTFPLVVGPRYKPGRSVADAAQISPPALPPHTRSGHDVEIAVTIDAGVPVTNLESPSHRTIARKLSDRVASVRLADDDTIPNKDFLLRWSVASERPAVGFLAHRDGLDGFFTLLVQPKGEVGPADAMPKEVTFVLDTSGSMSGIPLEASKRFAARALRALGPRDTFNLIRFSGDNEVYSKDPLPNDRERVEQAIQWFNGQSGRGGTEMLPAIETAFARPADPNRLRVVVFLTDGFVGNDAEILSRIANVVGDARIYTVGIGSSVNHHLLDGMADVGRGAYVFVRPDESADDALEAFRSWVTLPYLTDLSIDWGALPVADLAPDRLRDLGSGQTLSLVGRYVSAREGDVVVRGKLGGRYWEQTLHVALPEREPKNEALAALWARGRIEELLRIPGNPTADSVKAEVIALALQYRLMSPFTSFVAVDDSRVVNSSGESLCVQQALPLPEGVSFEGIFGKDGPAGVRDASVPTEDKNVDDEAENKADAINSTAMRSMSMAPPPPIAAGVVRGVVGGVAGGIEGGAPGGVRTETVVVVGEKTTVDLPVAGRFYQTVLALSPGVKDPDGDGNPNVAGARERDFKSRVGVSLDMAGGSPHESFDTRQRLLDAAFRVLADVADDGRLSPAEGRPALAALLAAQRASGAISEDVGVHAIASWALFEAGSAAPDDPWIARARDSALDWLVSRAHPTGWPARTGGDVDAEATRWARLVLGSARPASVKSIPAPAGESTALFAQLNASFIAAKNGAPLPKVTGRSAFERLLRSIGRGHLHVVRV